MKRILALAAVSFLTLAAAPASPPAYKVVPVTNGGTIAGRITYDGPHYERKQIMPTADAAVCGQHGMIESDDLVVSSGAIQYAVVRLTDVKEGRPASELTTPKLLEKGCMFHPHVSVIPVGATVTEVNDDGILHNVHTHSTKNPPVNFAHTPAIKDMKLETFKQPEAIKVTCDVHKWMSAWIWVSANPYIAVTGPDGSYKITGVPPGKYHLEIWQETLGSTMRDVTVAAGKTTKVDAALPVKK